MKTIFVILSFCFVSVTGAFTPAKKMVSLISEPKITRTYKWTYDNSDFALKLAFNKNDYHYYRQKSKRVATEQSYVRFATEDSLHPYYGTVLQQLDSIARTHHFNKSEFAGFVIAFVQQAIYYKKDPYNWGADYPRYGIETLVDHDGDCEDMACLLIGLLRTMDYDVALISIPGHIALGMGCADCDGSCFELNGRLYFYLESTGPGNPLGYEDSGLANRPHNLYAVPQTAFYYSAVNHTINGNNTCNCKDTLCTPAECCGPDLNKSGTTIKSEKPAPQNYNYIIRTSGNTIAPNLQPVNIFKISEMHVSGSY